MAKKYKPVFVNEEITERLERAKALAYVLADAAGGDLGVEAENVHHVSLMIAREILQAHELLEHNENAKKSARKEAA